MRQWKLLLLIPIAGLLAYSVFAGEISDHFRTQPDLTATEYDWRSDARLQDHGITEISFERPKSLDRTIWEAYTVRFFSDGRLEYTGYDHVRKMGPHVGRISTQEFRRLALLIEEMNYDGLDLWYYRQALNSWTNYTSVVRNGQRKTVQNYGDAGPVQLWAVELAIQDLVRKITWES